MAALLNRTIPARRTRMTTKPAFGPQAVSEMAVRFQQRRAALLELRRQVRSLRESGTSGIDCCHWFTDRMDEFLRELIAVETGGAATGHFAVLAVGGTGRRRVAPFSDVDLLMVIDPRQESSARDLMSAVTRACWDAGLQLGSSIRTPADILRYSGEDVQFATSLIEARVLAGNATLAAAALQPVLNRLTGGDIDALTLQIVAERRAEWIHHGEVTNHLEPDVKKSPGGLRDLHLLGWIAFLRHGSPDLAGLVHSGAISDSELATLQQADEVLTLLRQSLHDHTGLKQDVFSQEHQFRIAAERYISATDTELPVEVLMREHFTLTSRVARIARRVSDVPPRRPLLARIREAVFPRKTAKGFVLVGDVLHVPDDRLTELQDPMTLLDVFETLAQHRARLAPALVQRISRLAPRLPDEPAFDVCNRFSEVLRHTDGLPGALQAMYETGVLDWLMPPFTGIRCRIQINRYHFYTVDEHTLKAIQEMTAFAHDKSPVGSAYLEVRHRATLHMAMLLHDTGKGLMGDHSIVGEKLAEDVGVRLQVAANKKTMMMFLVRWHLIMPDIAFRRDISDSTLLIDFAKLIGAPELLRMLYVLSVADIRAVGPDVWNDWKGELLADLYNRVMQLLSGRPYNHLERERLQAVRAAVRRSMLPAVRPASPAPLQSAEAPAQTDPGADWAERQLDALPPFYLMMENPERIARDLEMIRQLTESDVRIEGLYDAETETVGYRVFAPGKLGQGSFHNIAGVLSGLRMNILAAQVCTTMDGVVIASFRVSDNDFDGDVPPSRIEDVAVAIGDVLTARKSIESVFRRSGLYRFQRNKSAIVKGEPKVGVDNDSSEKFTVVDIFATDTQGLLYTLAQTLFNHGLNVHLARIGTNVDQVVDVFYVLDANGRKLEDPQRVEGLKASLLHEIRLITD
jgi:[protein-PII] uridylyltransferase